MKTKTLLARGVIGGPLFVVAFVLSSAGFGQAEGLVDIAGLFQRIAVTVGFGWLTLLAVHLLRGPSEILYLIFASRPGSGHNDRQGEGKKRRMEARYLWTRRSGSSGADRRG